MGALVIPAAAFIGGFFTATVGPFAGLATSICLTGLFGAVLVPLGTPLEHLGKTAPTDFWSTAFLLVLVCGGYLLGHTMKTRANNP